MKHPWKKLLLAFSAVVFLFVALITVEHFRGAWMLKRWKARMAEKGEALKIEKLAPVLPPADQNGFPQLIWITGQLGSFPIDLQPPSTRYVAPGKCIAIWRLNDWYVRDSKRTNVISWVDVGEPLAIGESRIQSALEALQAESFSANIPYQSGLMNLPFNHLARLKSLAQYLSIGVLYDLHQNQTEAAHTKLKGLLALVDVQKEEPLLISQLVRIAIMHIAFNATWQALQHDGWSDEQLRQWQEFWARYDMLLPMERATCMERAMGVLEYNHFRESDLPLSAMLDPTGAGMAAAPNPSLLSWDWISKMFDVREQVFTPVWKFAWSQQDELYYCDRLQAIVEAQRRAVPRKAGAPLLSELERIEDSNLNPYDNVRFIMGRLMIGSMAKAFQRAWIAQTTSEIAVTAIGLKRHELRNRTLPDSLDELVPTSLARSPIDYMAGKLLYYCRSSAGGFLLYSVGRDGRDDGGNASSTTSNTSNFHFQNGRDLVWPQAASDEEVAAWRAVSAFEALGRSRRAR